MHPLNCATCRAGAPQASCKARAKAKSKAKAKAKAAAVPTNGVAEVAPKTVDELKAEMSHHLNFSICMIQRCSYSHAGLETQGIINICMRLCVEEGAFQCHWRFLGASPEPPLAYQFGGLQDPIRGVHGRVPWI